jgi:hypothetical protein
LRLVAICLFLLFLKIPFFFLGAGMNPMGSAGGSFLAAGVQLLSLLVEIYAAIVIFAYVYQVVGKPTVVAEDEDAAENRTDDHPNDHRDEPPTV